MAFDSLWIEYDVAEHLIAGTNTEDAAAATDVGAVLSDDPDLPGMLDPTRTPVGNLIFTDGFETGDRSRWSAGTSSQLGSGGAGAASEIPGASARRAGEPGVGLGEVAGRRTGVEEMPHLLPGAHSTGSAAEETGRAQ